MALNYIVFLKILSNVCLIKQMQTQVYKQTLMLFNLLQKVNFGSFWHFNSLQSFLGDFSNPFKYIYSYSYNDQLGFKII